MIRLGQNQINTAYLTLSDSVTLSSNTVYFLFRFVSETTNDEVLFTCPDISTNTLRYNQFNITVTGTTQNLTAGIINMNPRGEYIYEIYEQYSPTNLALSGTSGVILENGFVQLTGTSMSYTTQSYTGQSTTYQYYEP